MPVMRCSHYGFPVLDMLDAPQNMFKHDVCISWRLDLHAPMESLKTISLMTMERAPIIAGLCVWRERRLGEHRSIVDAPLISFGGHGGSLPQCNRNANAGVLGTISDTLLFLSHDMCDAVSHG